MKQKISYYQGKTTTREFEYHWDLELPYHCSVTSGTACAPFVSVQSDITNNPVITFSWGGWSDDMSGISQYQYQLFDMGKGDGGLMDGANSAGSGTLPDGKTSLRNNVANEYYDLFASFGLSWCPGHYRRGGYSWCIFGTLPFRFSRRLRLLSDTHNACFQIYIDEVAGDTTL
ncbi:unnamed protein product [Mytilus edulis]|uniref:Uncharacterized protein n=1 Tax=Mytilus edulis TaxID=6550 RepID=A0A8S3SJZ5_MYTED|nr:unnamed protein product [Mytilus edulis]